MIKAKKALTKNEVPVGAVVFNQNKVISSAYNMVICNNDPLGHAEIIALKKATKKLKTTNLMKYSLYVTLEPCLICSYIISKFKVGNLYFGAYDVKNGGIYNGNKFIFNEEKSYIPNIYGGIGEKESEDLLNQFFKGIRKKL